MTRPPRLLDSSSNDALRSLLSSGLDDAPDAQALPKVAAALGLSAVTVAASSLVASSVGAHAVSAKGAAILQSAALAGSAPATVAGSTGLSAGTALGASASVSAGAAGFWGGSTALALGKTLLVSMLSAGALSVGAVAVHEYTNPTGTTAVAERSGGVERAGEAAPGMRPASGTEQRAHAHAEHAPTAGTPAPEAAEPSRTVSERSDHLVQAAAAPLQRGSTVARQRPQTEARPENVSQGSPMDTDATHAGALGREVRQIDSARQALESKDADGALAALDSYERSRVVGVLDREALLLKIEALSQKQDLEQAKALARQYLQRFPTDAHAPRLRALLGASQGVGSTTSSVQAFPSE